uniref:ADP-ribosyl cyclase/cyclic ADP-ribose hydrolase n=1 Tax=Noccaea caerulescens TaxID=107243 RepID=A0A1J3H2R9_NOCCA
MKKSSFLRRYSMDASPQPQVFINFRGDELRHRFIGYLKKALERNGINAYIDTNEQKGLHQKVFFKRIEESKIALAIFSPRYTESIWCLDELVKMKECMNANKLVVIPIFYLVTPYTIKLQMGDFGDKLRELGKYVDDVRQKNWIEALKSVPKNIGINYDGKSDEHLLIGEIVEEVQRALKKIALQNGEVEQKTKMLRPNTSTSSSSISHNNNIIVSENQNELAGLKQRLEELKEKLDLSHKETRIVGVFGMPGIGKTTLVKKLYDEWKHNFQRHVHMVKIREKSNSYGTPSLQRMLLRGLLSDTYTEISDEMTYDSVESELLEKKVFLVLDDVTCKKQIQVLLGNHKWIRKGSRVVITTRDRTVIRQLEYTYVVPRLDLTDGLKRFSFYAFEDHNCPYPGILRDLSTKFVDYSRGNPLALKILGRELLSKDKDYWSERLDTLAQVPSPRIQDLLRVSYDELSKEQKEAFLVVACFFISGDEYYVRSLVDSEDPDSTGDAASEIRDLADKLLISISSGRVEMHDLLSTFGKKLCSSLPTENKLIWNHDSFSSTVKNKRMRFLDHPREKDQPNHQLSERDCVKGILLDMSELTDKLTLDSEIFSEMCNLRYLKVYNSQCSRDCDADCKLNFPDGLKCSMENLRYLYWLQYPLKKLPKAINPKNLIELNLPYSKITRLWKDNKDTSKLKWVDLSYSSELRDISGLLGAQNLKRLNLEGCTDLTTLPQGMQEMESLVYLNLGGCTRLVSLPEMKLKSLKTLILSYCLNLEQFPVISESLEALYLQGTAIKVIPTSIEVLQKLFLLNMKDCKALLTLPDCLGKLRALQELILSGCSKLQSFPELKENMKSIQILLLDGTAIKQMPLLLHCIESQGQDFANPHSHRGLGGDHGISSSLLSLCLSGNDLESLQNNISQLYHLKWLDIKNCKKLKSVPVLPPNLKCLDAHGCNSLEKVGNPLALLTVTGQIHCTFIFTNCNKLDQVAKSNIISYTRRKSQLMSDALNRYNGGFVLESLIGTCFPGCEVPSSFDHQGFGSLLEPKLPRHWCDNRLTGIALCAVILFPDYQEHESNRFLVKCTCEFESKDGPCISFTSIVGGWSVAGDEPRKIESAHVFIGYTSWLDINKRHVENHGKGCIPSKASLRFQVTDGASEVAKCQVLKCGFSLVYTPNDVDDISWETIGDIVPMKKEKEVDNENSNKHPRNDYSFWNQLNCGATSRRVECEELAEANISRTCFLD